MTDAFSPLNLQRMTFGDGDRANTLFPVEIAIRATMPRR